MSAPMMVFHIQILKDQISTMTASNGKVTIIPFAGSVKSDLFCGKVLPGAADVQVTNAAGIRHMCAKYMFEGTDFNGRKCHLYVENNGYFERGSSPSPFHAYPVFMSDSAELAEILSKPVYRSEGHPSAAGVDILIFDTTKETEEVPQAEEEEEKDPFFEELLAKQPEDEMIILEAERIALGEQVKKLIFFSMNDQKTYVIDNPDAKVIAAVLNSLKGTMQMVFMFNAKNELAAISYIAGKVRNIEDSSLNIFSEIFEENGGSRYFDQPLNRYARWRIRE